MDIIEAIEKRISCRSFDARPVEAEKVEAIEAEMTRIREESGLNFQLYGPREDGTVIDMSRGMFATNPPCYAALVAQEGPLPEEQLGYYGERLVLFVEQLGLATCWVAGTFDRKTTRVELAEGEKLHDVVPIGYAMEKTPLKQRTIRKGIRSRDKKPEALWQGATPLMHAPEWIRACIDGAIKGPSAINEQPVVFMQEGPGMPVRARLGNIKSGLEYTDLGIAKYHFEVVARACGINGTWEWGDGGAFVLE